MSKQAFEYASLVILVVGCCGVPTYLQLEEQREDALREGRLRRLAKRHGLELKKSRYQSNAGTYQLRDPRRRVIRAGPGDRQRGEELHSSSMVSYRAKGINKFTFVNLAVSLQQPDRKDFLLAASFSAGSPTATARLLCSTRSGVTCHPSCRCVAASSFKTSALPATAPPAACRATGGTPRHPTVFAS